MEANPVKVIQYFDGTKQNVIPLFQRAYTWNKENWRTLWDDVLSQYSSGPQSSHFMGAIVSMPLKTIPVGVNKTLVIDGQQRLTTIALLLCALRRVLDPKRAARIDDYLTNRHYDELDHFKLLPTNADREAFFLEIEGCPESPSTSRVGQAVSFFVDGLSGVDLDGLPVDAAKVLDTVEQCLQVVMINLGDADDPYLIFESLNHKGEPLTQADLVRNYVLMRFRNSLHSGGDQESVYTQLWRPVEESLKSHLTEFLRHYAMKDGDMIKQGGIYASTKVRFAAMNDTAAVKAELATMRQHAEAYERFVDPDREKRSSIADGLRMLLDLDVSTCYPLLLRLFEFNRAGDVSDDELERCLRFIESYVVRRAVVGAPPNLLSRLFTSWAKNLTSLDVSIKLHALMSGTRGRGWWPPDEEIKAAFEGATQFGRKSTRQILLRLEQAFEHKEPADLGRCTIEHVMPQRLSSEWVSELGVEHKATHERLIHTFGNLTLSAYNSEMGNQPFQEKAARLAESHLELNRWISKQSKWGEAEILERANQLFEVARKIWPGPDAM